MEITANELKNVLNRVITKRESEIGIFPLACRSNISACRIDYSGGCLKSKTEAPAVIIRTASFTFVAVTERLLVAEITYCAFN